MEYHQSTKWRVHHFKIEDNPDIHYYYHNNNTLNHEEKTDEVQCCHRAVRTEGWGFPFCVMSNIEHFGMPICITAEYIFQNSNDFRKIMNVIVPVFSLLFCRCYISQLCSLSNLFGAASLDEPIHIKCYTFCPMPNFHFPKIVHCKSFDDTKTWSKIIQTYKFNTHWRENLMWPFIPINRFGFYSLSMAWIDFDIMSFPFKKS